MTLTTKFNLFRLMFPERDMPEVIAPERPDAMVRREFERAFIDEQVASNDRERRNIRKRAELTTMKDRRALTEALAPIGK